MRTKAEILRAIAKNLNELADVLQDEVGKVEPAKKEPPKVTLEEVRSVLTALSAKGKTAQVRNLIEKYGAMKLSEVDPVHYAGIMEDAKNVSQKTRITFGVVCISLDKLPAVCKTLRKSARQTERIRRRRNTGSRTLRI